MGRRYGEQARRISSARTPALVHAHHYCTARLADEDIAPQHIPCSFSRLAHMEEIVARHHGDITSETMMRALADQEHEGLSICRHVDPGVPDADRMETRMALVMRPGPGLLLAGDGPPCQGSFQASTG